jgi:hypothetical protein
MDDQAMENEKGGRWHIRGRREMHTGHWWGNLTERDCFEYLGIDGSIIFKQILKVGCEGMDWINLAQDRGKLSGDCV